jgi:hypothetical protein
MGICLDKKRSVEIIKPIVLVSFNHPLKFNPSHNFQPINDLTRPSTI